jgi:predicted flap endonuclease-1-like 5' DNA nuclease
MNQNVIIAVAVILVIALLIVIVVRSRRQHVTFSDSTALPRAARPAEPTPPLTTPVAEGHGVTDEATAAIEDVIDQFIGIDAHPSGRPAASPATAPGDTLATLKGLGPRAASRLAELGVTRFDQIASWNAQEVESIDAQMGAFKGRIVRDRWVEQAKLLAAGDTAGFEEKFGKLGG